MEKLHLGVMTNKELARWFGIKETSFKQTKKRKLEELKAFAKFHQSRGKVIIEEIYIEEYSKRGSKAKRMIEDELDEVWNENGLDTCQRAGLAIQERLGDDLHIAESTTRQYTLEARKKLYGVPWASAGSLGSCTFIWCKRSGEGVNTKYDFLTEEEEQMKQMLLKKYFGDASEKQVIVQAMVENGEISKESAWEVLEELTGMRNQFYPFLLELQEKIGATIVRGTLVDKTLKIEEGSDW